jgi:hypothetical protein
MKTKSKLIPLPKLKKKAQDVFNKWIRTRDAEERCISCGGPVEQAGHYFSSGHYSALTFNETNVNGQCIRCNCFIHGNLIHYRMGLVLKYGDKKVKQLEKEAEVRTYKWSRTELEEIINKYRIISTKSLIS